MHGEKDIGYEYHEQNQQYSLEKMLSNILGEFSQLLKLLHKLFILKSRQQQFLMQEQLKNIQCKFKSSWLSQKMLNPPVASFYDAFSSSAIILKRFRCRLVQVILPYKQRIVNSPAGNLLSLTLHRLEKQIYRFQGGISLTQFLFSISNIFKNHLIMEKEAKKSGFENPEKITLNNELIKLQKSQKQVSRSKTFYDDSSPQRKMKKILNDIKSRFYTMEGLDLDFNHFRSSFFQVKNNEEEFYDQYLQRNKTISTMIKNYSKNFRDYLKRKEKRKIEKRLNLLQLEKQKMRSFAQTKSASKHWNFASNSPQIKKHSINPSYNPNQYSDNDLSSIKTNASKRLSFIERKIERQKTEEGPKKTQLQMKNIMITSSKFKFSSECQSPAKKVIKTPLKQGGEGFIKKFYGGKKILINNLPELCFRNKY